MHFSFSEDFPSQTKQRMKTFSKEMAFITNSRQIFFCLLMALLLLLPRLSESCVSCFHPSQIQHHNTHRNAHATSRGMYAHVASGRTNSMAVVTTAARQFLEVCKSRCANLHHSVRTLPHYKKYIGLSASAALAAGGIVAIAHHRMPTTMKQKIHRGLWRNELADGADKLADSPDKKDDGNEAGDDTEPSVKEKKSATSAAMIATLGIYKNFISPLIPPACRFVPTCSQYGVQAIEEFGPTKGVILTSWRLLRCTPFGGKGYDPPKWPPVEYTYSSY